MQRRINQHKDNPFFCIYGELTFICNKHGRANNGNHPWIQKLSEERQTWSMGGGHIPCYFFCKFTQPGFSITQVIQECYLQVVFVRHLSLIAMDQMSAAFDVRIRFFHSLF
jgi:hypothetical protein|uniref:Uncharacterized protein n=1 Tax=Populus trichocarpa TaxID=3694 RepID=A0A2K2BRV9_POPTR